MKDNNYLYNSLIDYNIVNFLKLKDVFSNALILKQNYISV